MSKGNKPGAKKPDGFLAARKIKTAANRIKRLQRTLKVQPENQQVIDALKTTKMSRTKPKVPQWSSYTIGIAKMMRKVRGAFDKDIFSKSPEVADFALRKHAAFQASVFKKMEMPKNPFSIKTQILGNIAWS